MQVEYMKSKDGATDHSEVHTWLSMTKDAPRLNEKANRQLCMPRRERNK